MATTATLRTARLEGRPIAIGDFAALRMLHSDPRVCATITVDGQPLSEEQTKDSIASWMSHWANHGFGVWMFCNHDGEFVGYAGVKHCEVEGQPEIELLYGIRPSFWKMNLATEMSKAVLQFGFEHAHLKQVVAFTLTTNIGSQRVMEKCGFRYERDITHAGLPHVLYRLSVSQFQQP